MSKLAPQRPVYKIDYLLDPRTVASFVLKAEGRRAQVTEAQAFGNRAMLLLAADIFLGNSDRFVNDVGGHGIQNVGNIFFVEKGTGEFKIKGLDVFDPSKNTALMSHTVSRGCERDPSPHNVDYWGGPLLKDSIQLRRVAANALTSLYDELSGVLRNGGIGAGIIRSYEFTDQHTQLVVAGMNAALIVIKASCKQRLAQMRKGKADTAGLKSRMKLMNWST